jgi:putative chitinase
VAHRDAIAWLEILVRCHVKPAVAARWAQVFARQVGAGTFSLGDAELDDFLGQILHESAGLTQFTENLHYSAERLCQVWPTRFPTLQEAQAFAYNPQALANRVYGGRMGNTQPGDGWKYRGRTPIQLTGKDAYRHVGALMEVDLVAEPDLLNQPDYALRAAILWWEDRIPDSMVGDPEKVTRRVNGGLIGLADRTHRTELAQDALAQGALARGALV